MAIHFDVNRWKQIKTDYTAWWNGTLDRPLIKAAIKSAYDPGRKRPNIPVLSMSTCNCLDYTAEQIIDALDYELCQYEFLGDAFPFINMAAFGPGIVAGFAGAELDNSTGSVWYSLKEKKPIEKVHIRYNPENVWACRIKEIFRAGRERWGNQVLMSMPDLGGIQDITAIFLGNEEYMYALYDKPKEVFRLQNEARTAFLDAFKDLENAIGNERQGYTDWSGLYSRDRSYIFQDDFAYMISKDMFEEFAIDDICKLEKEFTNVMYHLDGVGNLKHLDMLLERTNIKAYQWVYGAGQPTARHWMEIYDKLHEKNKNMEIIGSVEDFQYIAEKNPKGLYYHLIVDDLEGNALKEQNFKDCLSDYHIVERKKQGEIIKLIERYK